ncbi:energy transducer TonB [Flavobacteriaceae bacterium GSB9]|nr:energy transducer TonB [Flavobacteriaceae bacterium GSB9]
MININIGGAIKNLTIVLLYFTFNALFSQNISNKILDGSWKVIEANIDTSISNFNKKEIDALHSFFKSTAFIFNKKGIVFIKTDKSIPKPFNNNIFNKALYFYTANNTINIGNSKKMSNILYVQAQQKENSLLLNFNGAQLELKKIGKSTKLKIDKEALLSTGRFLENKPLINDTIEEIIENNLDAFSTTYNCAHLKNKSELKKCVSQTVMGFFMRKFNTEIASSLGLSGMFKSDIEFIINDKGHVTNISVESNNEGLSDEIIRTVNRFPRFIPAIKNNKYVNSKYSFPFVFQVQD